jgi:D-3-phosphoglycerate dehydrogenase
VAENMCDILDGKSFVGVVNAPDLGAVAAQPAVAPYVKLAEHIGSMQGQLLQGRQVGCVTIHLRGHDVSAGQAVGVIKAAVIKGVLQAVGIEQVSLVNAVALAGEKGLPVVVNMSEKTDASSGFMNSLSIELEVAGEPKITRTIEGTVFGRDEPRITQVDGYSIDLPPGEHMLVFHNEDRPGVLRRIATTLAQANINIAQFSLGRQSGQALAMGAVVTDSAVPAHVIAGLMNKSDIKDVTAVRRLVRVMVSHQY